MAVLGSSARGARGTRRGTRPARTRNARRRPTQPFLVQELHHVANLRGERADLVGRDEVAELLEVGATSGRVRHDDVRVGERAQVAFGERARGVETPVVRRERSAADLSAGDDTRASRCEPARGSSRGSPLGTSDPGRTRSATRRFRAPRPPAPSRAAAGGTARIASASGPGRVEGARGARAAAAPPRARAPSSSAARHRGRAIAGTATGAFARVRPGRALVRPSGRTARATGTRPRTRGTRGRGP